MMCGHHRRDRGGRRAPAQTTRLVADGKRASDRERETVVADLRDHAADGRLTVEELDARTTAALAATTRADLAELVADLPRRPRRRDPVAERRELREHVSGYLMVMALLVAIWALTGAGYFWPIWPILGWGIAVASHASAVGWPRRPRRSAPLGT